MNPVNDAETDRRFTRHAIRHALSAGAEQAQISSTRIDKREAVIGLGRSASLRRTHSHESTLTLIAAGKLGRAKLSGTDDAHVTAATKDALANAAASKHPTRILLAQGVGQEFCDYGDRDTDGETLVEKLLAYERDIATQHPAIVARQAQHGFRTTRHSFLNSNGVEHQETRGTYSFSTLFAARDRSSTTNFSSYGISSSNAFGPIIDQGDQHRRYLDAVQGLQARSLEEKFCGTIVIAPEALSFVMEPLLRDISVSLAGQHWLGREAADRVIASPLLSIQNCPHGSRLARGRNFDSYGVPTSNIDIVADGLLTSPLVDFLGASHHGLKQNYGWPSIVVQPGSTSLPEMIGSIERGILFSQFAGATSHDMTFSGAVTGAFSIVDGRIEVPVEHVMISGDMRSLLRNITEVSKETVNSGGAILPFVAARDVTIRGNAVHGN